MAAPAAVPQSRTGRWKDALELASKKESGWRRMVKKIIARYRGDDCMDEMGDKKKRRSISCGLTSDPAPVAIQPHAHA